MMTPAPYDFLVALMLLLQAAGSPTPDAQEEAVPEVPPSVASDPVDPHPAPVPPPDEDSTGSVPSSSPARSVWDDLADCESGNWIDGGASFELGSARWDWAAPDAEVPPWGTTKHHGGLQFLPATWSWLAPQAGVDVPHAYEATREQQIQVAELTLEIQGWGAWPVCSSKLGLR